MKMEKMREWAGDELATKEKEFADQLFRLKFQMASGQADTLEKIRGLRKDIARVKTLRRQNEIAGNAAEKASAKETKAAGKK
ncbi:MAG TPA: 50S ribosomal protein L29 [Terriglobia bacterium]|nr:50S ribosomal protein L29 [Terriglobia bacterium]